MLINAVPSQNPQKDAFNRLPMNQLPFSVLILHQHSLPFLPHLYYASKSHWATSAVSLISTQHVCVAVHGSLQKHKRVIVPSQIISRVCGPSIANNLLVPSSWSLYFFCFNSLFNTSNIRNISKLGSAKNKRYFQPPCKRRRSPRFKELIN